MAGAITASIVRRKRRAGTGDAAVAVPVGQAFDFSGGGYYYVDGSSALDGNVSGMVRWAAFKLDSISTVSDYLFTYRDNGVLRGWALRLTSTGTANAFFFDGGGGLVETPAYTLTTEDIDKIHTMHVRCDGSNAYFYFDGQYIGFVALTTYTAPTAGDALTIGATVGFASTQHTTIIAAGGSDGSSALAEDPADHYAAIRLAQTGVAMGVTGEVWWNADSAISGGVAASTWVDETATETLAISGTVAVEDPTFTMPPLAHGTRGQTAATRYFTRAAGSTLLDGSTSMTIYMTGAAMARSSTAWTNGNNYVADKAAAGVVEGWALRLVNTGLPTIRGEIANGSGVLTATNSANTAGIALKDLITIAVTLDNDELIIYLNGAAVGSPVACVGYTPPGGTRAAFLHAFASSYNRDFSLFGFGFDGANAATPAEVAAWHTACDASNQGFEPMGLAAEVAWSGEDGDAGVATWPDTTATYNWTRSGVLANDHVRARWQ